MTKRKAFYLITILLCLFIMWQLVEFLIVYLRAEKISLSFVPNQAAVQYAHFSKLDGTGFLTKAEETPRVVGIMIDNHPDARPGSGLAEARVVYETPVEGGITRYFAIYNASSTVSEVGPVRSARPYFLDWISEYGIAPYLHSGGSPEALALLKKSKLFDVNEFWRGKYFWRDAERGAPHNLYTNSERWQELIANVGDDYHAKNWEGWKFDTSSLSSRAESRSKMPRGVDLANLSKGIPPLATLGRNDSIQTTVGRNDSKSATAIKAIKIPYAPNYVVEWKLNLEGSRYERYLNGHLQLGRQGERILADNVLVQFVVKKVLDEEGRLSISTIGGGEARAINKNTFVRGLWRKETQTSRTRWYDEANSEVTLTPGVTWVQVVPAEISLEVTN